VTDRPAYDAARKVLGASAIVGADCGASRHFAMEMAEAGADYVGLANGGEGGFGSHRLVGGTVRGALRGTRSGGAG
jgi:hypothetical protein